MTTTINKWRKRLIEELKKRPYDNLTGGGELFSGRPLPMVRDFLLNS